MAIARNQTTQSDYFSIGPDDLAGRFLRRFWQPIYLAEELSAGKARPVHILGENFTLYRGETGAPHLVGSRCAHRKLLLSVGRVEDDCLRCFYHGWKYDADGQCIEQPAEKQSFADKVKIAGYPTREYLGLIFAYLGGGDPPYFPTLDAFEGGGFVQTKESPRPWGYFNQLENSVDEVHFNFVHRRSKFTDVGLNDEIPDLSCNETDYGLIRIGQRGNNVRKSHILMPNCMYSMVYDDLKGWSEHLSWRVPIDVGTHTSFVVDFIHKTGKDAEDYRRRKAQERTSLKDLEPAASIVEKIFAGDLSVDEVPDRPDIIYIQDAVALMGQEEARDRSEDILAASDRQVTLLRKIWSRELKALADGRPLKQWRIPRDLVPTKGISDDRC